MQPKRTATINRTANNHDIGPATYGFTQGPYYGNSEFLNGKDAWHLTDTEFPSNGMHIVSFDRNYYFVDAGAAIDMHRGLHWPATDRGSFRDALVRAFAWVAGPEGWLLQPRIYDHDSDFESNQHRIEQDVVNDFIHDLQ